MPTRADPWRDAPPPLPALRRQALAPHRRRGRPGAERWDLLVWTPTALAWVQHRALHAARPGAGGTGRTASLVVVDVDGAKAETHRRPLHTPHDGQEPTLTIARAHRPGDPPWDLRLVPGGGRPRTAAAGGTWVLPWARAHGQAGPLRPEGAPAALHRAVEGAPRTLFVGASDGPRLLLSRAGRRAEILLERDGSRLHGPAAPQASPGGDVLQGLRTLRGLAVGLRHGPAAGAVAWRDPDGRAGWTTVHPRAVAVLPALGLRIPGAVVRDTRDTPDAPLLVHFPGAGS